MTFGAEEWFGFECTNGHCPSKEGRRTGVILDVRLEGQAAAPLVPCPACLQSMHFKARWPATPRGYGSRGDTDPVISYLCPACGGGRRSEEEAKNCCPGMACERCSLLWPAHAVLETWTTQSGYIKRNVPGFDDYGCPVDRAPAPVGAPTPLGACARDLDAAHALLCCVVEQLTVVGAGLQPEAAQEIRVSAELAKSSITRALDRVAQELARA